MKETTFIEQNKRKWAKFEKLSKHKSNDPDEVSELFTEITEDLSYARTFYPRRSVRVYLNQLAQGVFTKLYKQKKQPLGSFILFWKEKIPLELYRMRYNMLAAVTFFMLAVFLGAVSQHYDPEFINLVVGDEYVEITEENINKGDPMGIYGSSPQVSMFFRITINNIRVAFITFALGIFASLGSYLLLLNNGIMLGAFQWWFKIKGLLLASFLAIWIHGAFEISAIVIAGGAGITVGNGLLFPKSYSRLQSLVFSAKRGLLVMLSLVPIFIIAGALESFVTRYYNSMPDILKWFIILFSFGSIILYYGVYPFIVAKKFPEKIDVKENPRHIPERKIDYLKIRNIGEFFSDSFYLFISKIRVFNNIFFKLIFPLAIGIGVLMFSINFYEFDFLLDWNQNMELLFGSSRKFNLISIFGWPIILSLLICLAYFSIDSAVKKHSIVNYLNYTLKPFISVYLYALILFSIFVFFHWLLLISIIVLAGPVLSQIPSYILIKKNGFFSALVKAFKFEKNSYGEGIGNVTVFTVITIIFFLVLHNPMELGILPLVDGFLKDTLIINVDSYRVVINAFNSFVYLIFIGFMMMIIFMSSALFYYSNNEKSLAKGLYKRLSLFGTRNRNFETESDYD
jgi:uncharacterized membrane protein SpoIIM required for sporulation